MSFLNNKYFSLYRDTELEAFYDVDLKYRRKIIYSHMMVHLLPVSVVGVVYWLLPDSAIVPYLLAGSVLVYIIIITETISYLFPKSRDIYKKYYIWMLMPLFLIASYGGYHIMSEIMATESDLEGEFFSYMGYILFNLIWAMGLFIWAHIGLAQILYASRVLYTRKAEVEADVRFATEVQNRILQDISVQTDDISAYACSIAANELGGDYFELVRRENRLFATVGDVSGHSFGAGLIMTLTKSAVQTHLEYNHDPAKIMTSLNRMLLRQSDRSMYATMIMLKIDLATLSAELCNAGHLPILHINGNTGELNHRYKKGMGLGIHEKAEYSNLAFPITRGDLIIMFSDGLIETRDREMKVRELSDFVQIIKKIKPEKGDYPAEIATTILKTVKESDFSEKMEDDSTVIVIKL